MNGTLATIHKNENGEYVAKLKGVDGRIKQEVFYFSNNGVGFEFEENEEILIIETVTKNEKTFVKHFYKIHNLYELESEDDGINYNIFKIKKVGDEILKKELVELIDEEMELLPGEIKVKIILFNKRRKQKEQELNTILEEILFSMQNNEKLEEIKEEYKEYKISFILEIDQHPFITIEKDGAKKTLILNWDRNYHKNILIENNMRVPIELVEQEIREIKAEDLLLSDFVFSEDGSVIIINGVKYYFKKPKDKEKLKDLNPQLYEKICKAMVGKKLKEEDIGKLKEKYKELKVLTEDGELELRYEEKIDYLTVRSFQNYIQRMMAKEIDVPIHVYTLSDEEILFYLGEDKEITVSEFKERAKEILKDKLKEFNEFYGWEGAEEIFINDFLNNHFTKTIGLQKQKEDEDKYNL